MVKEFAARHGQGLRSVAVLVGTLATTAALLVGAVLAVYFAATVAVIAVMASALLAFAGLALRARRTARRPYSSDREPDLIEARHQGGHHWVAYGWNERR